MLIELKDFSKRFGRLLAVSIPDLRIDPGQIAVVLGANGAGKTTLFRCLAGLVIPSAGQILYNAKPFYRGDLELRRNLMFLPDFPFMFGEMTVIQHISMVLKLYECDAKTKLEAALEHLRNLDLLPFAEAATGRLSRGQQYKAALSALLTLDPELWILDEPFASGMDPQGIFYFKTQARAAAERGRTVLYSTQILDVAENLSDRIILLNRGALQMNAALNQLQARNEGNGGVLEEMFRSLREQK